MFHVKPNTWSIQGPGLSQYNLKQGLTKDGKLFTISLIQVKAVKRQRSTLT